MKVLMVTLELPSPGNPNTIPPIARQIQSLRDRGVEVEVFEIAGKHKIKYAQALRRYPRRIHEDIDIIHAHYGYCGMFARMQWRKPLVVSFMGNDLLGTPDNRGRIEPLSRIEVFFNRCLARIVDGIIVKSNEMAQVLAPLKVHVVPNGVDLDVFSPMDKNEARKKLGWPADKRYIFFPGDPGEPRKGYEFATEAVRLAAEKMNEPLEIVSLYKIPHQQVPFYMNACDLVLMTSYIEGSPNVVKEAMACNRPIVSVPVGDVVELLIGVPGCTIVNREQAIFADAVAATLKNVQTSAGRRALIEKELDIQNVARKIIRIYEETLAKKGILPTT